MRDGAMRELLLVRHGQSTGNVARERAEADGAEVVAVEARDADVSLTELGIRQAQALGRRLADAKTTPHAVWCSPYRRARQTADTALRASGLALPVRIDERLRDRELGVLDTLTQAGMLARFPEEVQRRRHLGRFYYRAPGGESWADLALRIRSVLADLQRVEADRVLVVTHDAMVLLFRYVCEGLEEEALLRLAREAGVGNAALTRLRWDGGDRWCVAEFNDRGHLLPGDSADRRGVY